MKEHGKRAYEPGLESRSAARTHVLQALGESIGDLKSAFEISAQRHEGGENLHDMIRIAELRADRAAALVADKRTKAHA